jgi:hypothetical protein
MPGEVTGCVGCHEPRTTTPDLGGLPDIVRKGRKPTPIQPFDGFPDVLDFVRDIQPILDQHCVSCHGPAVREGGVLLSGDLGPVWSHSYFSLLAHLQVADGRNGLGNYPPRSIGSSASPLLEKLSGGHHDVVASPEQWRTVWLWIESGAPFAGSYSGLRNAVDQSMLLAEPAGECSARTKRCSSRRCGQCHALREPQGEHGRPLPFRSPAARDRGVSRAVGVYERVVIPDDPLARYSTNILLNSLAARTVQFAAGAVGRRSRRLPKLRRHFRRHDRPGLSATAGQSAPRQGRVGCPASLRHSRICSQPAVRAGTDPIPGPARSVRSGESAAGCIPRGSGLLAVPVATTRRLRRTLRIDRSMISRSG